MEETIVGNPINFRGFIYSPVNEQGVVFLFGLIAEDLNIRVESVQQGYPDCTGIKYHGKGKWKRIRIEFEYKSGNFDHDPTGCDIVVCWEDNLSDEQKKSKGIDKLDIVELKSIINTPEVPQKELKEPKVTTSNEAKFDLKYHFERKNVDKNIQHIFEKFHESIMRINPDIWDKYSKTAITYYSPERMFVFLRFRKTKISLNIFTNEEKIENVKNMKNHENWGVIGVSSDKDMDKAIIAIKRSSDLMKEAVKNNIKTGWYALTPKDLEIDEDEDDEVDSKPLTDF